MEKWVRFDPRVFINPPFVMCPKCGQVSFGVLTINKFSYTRRCKNCLYPSGHELAEGFPLPKLNKKIIYLDQFAISNMMKAINPNSRAFQEGKVDCYWLELFTKLDRLCKMQLIVCPDSQFHKDESLMFHLHDELKMIYEHFSHGVSFYDNETINRYQVHYSVQKWITSKEDLIKRESVIHGDIKGWQERFRITVNIPYDVDYVDELRRHKEQTHEGLSEVFRYWRLNANPDFFYWYRNEFTHYGDSLIRKYVENYKKAESGDFSVFPSASILLINTIQDVIKSSGITDIKEIWRMTIKYFESIEDLNVPFLNISAALFASIARKVAAGQTNPPNKGTMYDIEMISSLLPYCDAMFIDGQFAGYLREYPVNELVNYNTKIFSFKTRDDFMEFLDDIERESGTEEHISALDEVYGDSWMRPYFSMFESK